MTGKQRIEHLTQTWYGFTVLAAVASVIQVMLWPFSPALLFSPMRLALTFVGAAVATVFAIALNLVGAAIGLFIVYLLGRALMGRSNVTRVVLVVVSAIGAVLGVVSGLPMLWSGVVHFSPSTLLAAAVTGAMVLLYVRSIRVLRDPSVKEYMG